MYKWKVVPLCERQLRDVDASDILNDGLYRRCKTYKSGGGYDKFSDIYARRSGLAPNTFHEQFVVQLYGCPLKCPYCYVTQDGIFGEYKLIDTNKLVYDFAASDLEVFHLMGGAPALYIDHWIDIVKRMCRYVPFHSDMLLVESLYDDAVLEDLAKFKSCSLYAVSVKGSDVDEFKKNTGISFNEDLFWTNFDKLVKFDIPFYLTFTGMSEESINNFKNLIKKHYHNYEDILRDSFAINLVHYNALD